MKIAKFVATGLLAVGFAIPAVVTLSHPAHATATLTESSMKEQFFLHAVNNYLTNNEKKAYDAKYQYFQKYDGTLTAQGNSISGHFWHLEKPPSINLWMQRFKGGYKQKTFPRVRILSFWG